MTRLLRHLRRRAGDESGAAIILVAVCLPVLVLFGLFVVDVGNWWVHKRHLQTQADAAALAGARSYRFPLCSNQSIVESAVDYSGGVLADPDVNYAAFNGTPLPYNYQLAASERPGGPTQGIHTQVNTPDPYDGAHPTDRDDDSAWVDDDLQAMDAAERPPCSSLMLDVKMTETDIAGRMSPLRFFDVLGFLEFVDARARVELRKRSQKTDLMPLAVEDVNPKKVHVWLYDEDTQKLLGEADLKRDESDTGMLAFDNSVGNDGTPIVVNFKPETIGGANVTKRRIGAVVALSGTDTVDCTVSTVQCYGTSSNGLTRIRGAGPFEGSTALTCKDGLDNDGDGAATFDNFDDDCLGGVYILKDGPNCSNDLFGARANGYFSTTCTKANLAVELPGFTGENAASNQADKKVIARVQSNNGTTDVELHWVGANSRWETTGTDRIPISALGAGTRSIDILWEQRKLTLPGVAQGCSTNQNGNLCKGSFTNVHKTFTAARANAGPIRELRIDVDGNTNVNNVTRCRTGTECPHSIVVKVGLTGRLELTPPDSPPISLRLNASGPGIFQTQQLNCQPSTGSWTPMNADEEFANGCEPLYGIKDDNDPCPSKAALHGSPNPPAWECVAVKTGAMNGPVGKGLNQRILCAPLNSAGNCPQQGKPIACTNPNHYPDYPDGDPRILTFFLVPYGSLDISGSGSTVPVIGFADFYVTGWHSKGGGFDNPCTAPPDVFDPASDPTDQGVISGYFINPVDPNLGGDNDQPCDPNSLGGCVAVMTK